MMTFLMIFLSVNLTLLMKMSNPVKTSFSLMFTSVSVFMYLFMFNSSSWFSMIFFMLFIGGIMIMFMVLSSLLPNEKSVKIKNMIFISFMIVSFNLGGLTSSLSFEMMNNYQTKLFFQNSWNFEVLMMTILIYFLSFVYILSKETMSLRSIF